MIALPNRGDEVKVTLEDDDVIEGKVIKTFGDAIVVMDSNHESHYLSWIQLEEGKVETVAVRRLKVVDGGYL